MKKFFIFMSFCLTLAIFLLMYFQVTIAGGILSGAELKNSCRVYAEKAAVNTQKWLSNSCVKNYT